MIIKDLRLKKSLSENIFRQIHGNNLVYNTCWEDPRCDRELLQINPESQVVVITSAGCNALDYLLDNPKAVHCVDMNPRQNALMHLKLALFQNGDHHTLFELLGKGWSREYRAIHESVIDPALTDDFSKRYWRHRRSYFSGKGTRASFYWHGTSGTVAWLIQQWLSSRPSLKRMLKKLFEAETLEQQRSIYAHLEPRLFNPFFRWLIRQHFVQSMLGVPKSQQSLAASRFSDGMVGYIRQCFRQVFTQQPLQDNYFWRLYFTGHYSPDCCPAYLKQSNFEPISASTHKIKTYTSTISQFLEQNPGSYTHFVLLDHQDWLAAHHKDALEQEWDLILQNAAPGAKVLLRSAAFEVDFLPQKVAERVQFDPVLAQKISIKDRVGTYASTLIGTIA